MSKPTKKIVKKAAESPYKAAYLDKVHDAGKFGFIEDFAECFSLQNMGFDAPGDLGYISEIQMEYEGVKAWNAEMRGWRKVGKVIEDVLKAQGLPLTLRNAVVEFEGKSNKKYTKLYAK